MTGPARREKTAAQQDGTSRSPASRGSRPSSTPRWERVGQGAVALLLAWMTWIVTIGLFPGRGITPGLVLANQTLQLEQRWRIFGNTDPTSRGWFLVVGNLLEENRSRLRQKDRNRVTQPNRRARLGYHRER